MTFTSEAQLALLNIAREVIRATLARRDAALAALDGLPELHAPAACFVSLHELQTRRLRGCVGSLDATRPVEHAVASAARSVLEDPRFTDERVTLELLPQLEMELSLLSPMRAIATADEFELLSDGVYLKIGQRCGCFLPQVARETGWTRQQLLARLCLEKLQLPIDAWQHPHAQLFKFTTLIIGPEPFEPTAAPPTL